LRSQAEKKLSTIEEAARGDVATEVAEVLKKMKSGYSKWSMKSKVFSFSNKWKINLKKVSEKVGPALNDDKDDEDVQTILKQAADQTTKIQDAITANIETFKAELKDEAADEATKAEFEAALRAAGDEVKSKLSGIKIFSDIAKWKAAANKKTKEIKDTMSRAVVQATEDSQVEEAMTKFETEAKKVADDLIVNIAAETKKGKELQKPE